MSDEKPRSRDTFFTAEIFSDRAAARPGAAAGAGGTGANYAATIGAEQGLEVFDAAGARPRRPRSTATWREPARDIPLYSECDVLVVGGGPAGTTAAVAAARLGADVLLLERYNHLGGLSTGGLVIWIDRMTDWSGTLVIRGLAEEIMDRHPGSAIQGPPRADWGSKDAATAAYWAQRTAAFHGIVTHSPTIDPEHLKTVSMQLVLEAKARLVLHAWGSMPIVEDGAVRGVVFESKEGRQAIRAKVVVDTTGDADLIQRAGATMQSDIDESDIHHCINTAFMLGGVDMERWLAFRRDDPQGFADFMQLGRSKVRFFEKAFVSWRNDIALFMGPRLSGYSAVDVDDLTAVEIRSRELTVGHLDVYRRHAPGFENAFLMLGAPQIGVRHSRRLSGVAAVSRQHWGEGTVWPDEIGVSPPLSPKFKNISVPYGALVPAEVEGILGAGRHVACDASSHTFMREIPQCWLTGHAAGVAAALAAAAGRPLRALDPRAIQAALRRQGAHLSLSTVAETIRTAAE